MNEPVNHDRLMRQLQRQFRKMTSLGDARKAAREITADNPRRAERLVDELPGYIAFFEELLSEMQARAAQEDKRNLTS